MIMKPDGAKTELGQWCKLDCPHLNLVGGYWTCDHFGSLDRWEGPLAKCEGVRWVKLARFYGMISIKDDVHTGQTTISAETLRYMICLK